MTFTEFWQHGVLPVAPILIGLGVVLLCAVVTLIVVEVEIRRRRHVAELDGLAVGEQSITEQEGTSHD